MDGSSAWIPREELNFKTRVRASILWLMSKAYKNDVPIQLLDPFDELSDTDYQFKDTIVVNLTNAEYYASCLVNIYSEPTYACYTHSNIVQLLVEKRIFRDDVNLDCFSEYVLAQTEPFALEAHMSIIEGLMNLYIFEILNPNHVATVCDSFIPVHNDEIPEDAEEAAIFWLNKSCLRKKQEIIPNIGSHPTSARFQIRHHQYHDSDTNSDLDDELLNDLLPIIPLENMSDISDGCALAVLLSLYCPNDFSWQDISFDTQESSKDCVYNLNRIQHFCKSLLPYNICFLNTESFYYFDSSIKTNILAFIADLWYAFVIKPCDLVIEPCRIMQSESFEELLENERISDMNHVSHSTSPSQSNSLSSKVVTSNQDEPSSEHHENGTEDYTERRREKNERFDVVMNDPKEKKQVQREIAISKPFKSITMSRHSAVSTNSSNKPDADIKEESRPHTNGSDTCEKPKPQAFLIDSDTKAAPKVIVEKDTKKKDAIMLLSSKRKAELEAKKASKETELSRLKEEAAAKQDLQEQRRLENKKRREMILEQYRQRKKTAEANKVTPQNERSQTIPIQSMGNVNANNQNSKQTSQSISIRSIEYTGPKLFRKPICKTNLNIIHNAIVKALEGAPNAKTLKRVQDKINARSQNCRHFLILFRGCQQFRGLYEYNDKQQAITKLDGIGPKIVNNEDIIKYYKFDFPKRQFDEVQTKNISLTIIAFSIHDNLWLKNNMKTKESA